MTTPAAVKDAAAQRRFFLAPLESGRQVKVRVIAQAGRLVLHHWIDDSVGRETSRSSYVISLLPQGLDVLPGEFRVSSIRSGKALLKKLAALANWPLPDEEPRRGLRKAVYAACGIPMPARKRT